MPKERPNFLFIQCDQLAARALKAYGNTTVKASTGSPKPVSSSKVPIAIFRCVALRVPR